MPPNGIFCIHLKWFIEPCYWTILKDAEKKLRCVNWKYEDIQPYIMSPIHQSGCTRAVLAATPGPWRQMQFRAGKSLGSGTYHWAIKPALEPPESQVFCPLSHASQWVHSKDNGLTSSDFQQRTVCSRVGKRTSVGRSRQSPGPHQAPGFAFSLRIEGDFCPW